MKLDRDVLVRVLRTEGDNDTADKVDADLPDGIDTDRDGDALDRVGLDGTVADGQAGRRRPRGHDRP